MLEAPAASESAPLLAAPSLSAAIADLPPPQADRPAFDLEQARIAAWKKLIGQSSQLYPKAKAQSEAIKLQLTAPTASKPGVFQATNSTPQSLTNVTLAIELVHVMTSPSP